MKTEGGKMGRKGIVSSNFKFQVSNFKFQVSSFKFQVSSFKFQVSKGFTLIETLVAMMILSISLVIILQLFSGGLRSGKLSENYTRAIFHAREKMEETLLAKALEDEVTEGNFEDGFKWKSEIVYLAPEEKDGEKKKEPVDMFNITIEISWNEGRNKKHFQISTLKIAKKLTSEDDRNISL
ncbi:type IV pilus modification PilV family protein [Desulfonema magnum]|uniref:Prepilin-type N-terminal cleavage/methylation domain-containing protein n=1 Tax=Desulfonema magnum TaxID=45655 RepID=A0A975GK39_9BACT|nr:type II secretion system protein [Desulfonema magnum]QTA84344.1 Prepilin-type N-terminal cleavage/methylation domain-containing protein [Desulfonema magnum]